MRQLGNRRFAKLPVQDVLRSLLTMGCYYYRTTTVNVPQEKPEYVFYFLHNRPIQHLILICFLSILVMASETVALDPNAIDQQSPAPKQISQPIASPAIPGTRPSFPEMRNYSPTNPPSSSADWVVKRMAMADSADLRKRAAEVWPIADDDMENLKQLIRKLSDPDAKVQSSALHRIKQLDKTTVFAYAMRTFAAGILDDVKMLNASLPALHDLLGDLMLETLRTEIEMPLHKRIAAYCLGQMGVHAAVDDLAECVWSDDPSLAHMCIESLARINAPSATLHWRAILDHPDLEFKQYAVTALSTSPNPIGFNILSDIVLGRSHSELQRYVLKSISGYPPLLLFPLLIDVMEQNAFLRKPAADILRQQTQMDLGPDPSAWRSWFNNTFYPSPPPIVPAP